MPSVVLITEIKAPIERCFNLARSIEVHLLSTCNTNEKAIGGIITGLISKGETVTWRAKHLGRYSELTTVISEMDHPDSFIDEQLKGPFKKIYHRHLFHFKAPNTFMTDVFEFESPYGKLGKFFDRIFLARYMTKLLRERNAVIKRIAEGDEWKKYLETKI